MNTASDSKFEDNPLLAVTKTDKDRDKVLSNLKPKCRGKRKKRETSKNVQMIQTKSPTLPPVSSLLSNVHKTSIPLHHKGTSLHICKYLDVDPKDMAIHDLDSQDEDLECNQKLTNIPIETSIHLHVEKQKLFESDKKKIYKHPLFPLMSFLLEKCEIATFSINDVVPSKNINQEVRQIAKKCFHFHEDKFQPDIETNDLMIRAIQVLRIHLLELEKVQELCKEFCSKYITCIKEKMKCEHVLKTEYGGYDSDEETGYLTSKNKLIEVPVSRQSLRYCNNLNMRSKQVILRQNLVAANAKMGDMPALLRNDVLGNFS